MKRKNYANLRFYNTNFKTRITRIKTFKYASDYFKRSILSNYWLCMEVHRELGMGFKEIVYKMLWNMNSKQETYPIPEKKSMKSNTKISYSHVVITLNS